MGRQCRENPRAPGGLAPSREKEYLGLLDQGVAWAKAEGLYVIIDWHSIGNLPGGKFFPGSSELYPPTVYRTTREETFDFWKTMARHYRGNNTVAFFELFNEPALGGDRGMAPWPEWKGLLEDLIKTIRASGGTAVPLVAGFNFGYDLTPVAKAPINAEGIGYVAHPYPMKAQPPWETNWTRDWGFVSDKYPMILTEIGFLEPGAPGGYNPITGDESYGDAITSYCARHGISYTVWCFDPHWGPCLIKDPEFHADPGGRLFQKGNAAEAAVTNHRFNNQNIPTAMKRLIIILPLILLSACATRKPVAAVVAPVVPAAPVAPGQKFNQLALTPPMGWNSWNKFACDVNEQLIRETAAAMATNGMKDAGYQYVNIDDCWHGERDAQGFIHPNPQRFPSGMKALADYVHSQGLKLGIYSDAGAKTCGGRPGSRGHEYQDALTYAQWGVDYVKYDWCGCEDLNAKGAYTTMRDAIYAAGRPMVFSMCEWGQNKPWLWAKDVSHLWRTTTDINPCFDCTIDHTTWQQWGVLRILDAQKPLREYAGPGHWNDPDMLEVGNGMTVNEDRAHFSMWCLLAAPLISGNDLRHMSKETAGVLLNHDVIAVDQDKLGIEAFMYSTNNNVEVWFKPLDNDAWAMCVLNRGTNSQSITFDWKNEKVADDFSKRETRFDTTNYRVRDLWTKKDLGTTQSILTAEVLGHDVLMVRLDKM